MGGMSRHWLARTPAVPSPLCGPARSGREQQKMAESELIDRVETTVDTIVQSALWLAITAVAGLREEPAEIAAEFVHHRMNRLLRQMREIKKGGEL